MIDFRQPICQRLIRVLSRLLLWVGAAVFVAGDAYLFEIRHVNFFASVALGIGGGILVMLLGAAIAVANESSKLGQR